MSKGLSKQQKRILEILTKEFLCEVGEDKGKMILHNWHSRNIMRELGLEVTPSREASFSRSMKGLQEKGLVSSRYREFTHGKVFEVTDKGIEYVKSKSHMETYLNI